MLDTRIGQGVPGRATPFHVFAHQLGNWAGWIVINEDRIELLPLSILINVTGCRHQVLGALCAGYAKHREIALAARVLLSRRSGRKCNSPTLRVTDDAPAGFRPIDRRAERLKGVTGSFRCVRVRASELLG